MDEKKDQKNNKYNTRRRNKSFANFLQSSKEQITITDINGKILFVNNLLVETTQYSLDEIIGNNPRLWGSQMSKSFYEFIWQKIKKNKKPISAIITNRKKNGEKYDVRVRISPVLNSAKEIEFFVGIESVL